MKMNNMSQKIEGMTRILVEDNNGVLDFGFYKDGMIQIGDNWHRLDEFNGWCTINQLKGALNHIERIPNKSTINSDTYLVLLKDILTPYRALHVGDSAEASYWAKVFNKDVDTFVNDFNHRLFDNWFRIKEEWE